MKRTLLLALMLPLAASATTCTVNTQRAAQADGSTLVVSTQQCPNTANRLITVSIKLAKQPPRVLQRFRQSAEHAPTGGAILIDIDQDGFSEVQLTGACGSGAVCAQDLYKLNPTRNGFFLLYSGAYADLDVLNGYLVDGGKSGCCTWNYKAYELPRASRRLTESDVQYRIQVGMLDPADPADPADPGAQDGEPADCRFTTRSGARWVVVKPPSKALEKICELYGPDYVLDKPR